jgi:hypothetical protein
MSDTMSRQRTSTLSSHDILVTLVGANTFATGNTIVYDFGEDSSRFSVADSGWVAGDFDFNDGTERTIFAVTQGASPTDACSGSSGSNDVGVEVDTDDGIITVRGCGSMAASGAAATVNFEIGSAAAGPGTNRITNPSSAASYPIPITETSDSGTLAVPILTNDQVTVSATVDPTITSTLSSTTCSLGTLSSSSVSVCTYFNTVLTNASSGFVSTITQDDNLCRIIIPCNAGNDIDAETGGDTISSGTEEYGVSSDDTNSTQDVPDYDGSGCNGSSPENAGSIATTQSYALHTGPVGSGDVDNVTNLCHVAAISATTGAGVYTQIVTHITTGTF